MTSRAKTINEGVVAQWCNPLALKPEHSRGVGSIPGRTPSLGRHDKGSRTRLRCSITAILAIGAENTTSINATQCEK